MTPGLLLGTRAYSPDIWSYASFHHEGNLSDLSYSGCTHLFLSPTYPQDGKQMGTLAVPTQTEPLPPLCTSTFFSNSASYLKFPLLPPLVQT